jgi:hypothetical protein
VGVVVACVGWALPSAAQALPNLSVNLNANGKIHITWAVPTVSAVLQESSSLNSTGAWQTSSLNITTNNCNCQVLAPPNSVAKFYRLASTNPPRAGIYLGASTQLLQQHQLGMTTVPDMHTAMLQESNTYHLWITGHFEDNAIEGATGLLLTTNFVDFASGYSPGTTNVVPVFVPSSRGSNYDAATATNFDANYAGANLVWTATNGTDLLMLCHAGTLYYGTSTNAGNGWASVGLVRSSDQGITWTNRQQIISGSDPKPDKSPNEGGVYGVVEPGAILASNYIYAYYAFFPTNTAGVPTLQVARSAVRNDGAPGTWFKYYTNAFKSPGLLGQGSQIVPTVCGCTRNAQPWPVFSTYLNAYVLVFIANEGWFFSTSTNLVTWSSPTQFFSAPNDEFTQGLPTDENVILVTPGNPDQVIGQTGLVLYSHTPAWHSVSDELWSRPFTFSKNP